MGKRLVQEAQEAPAARTAKKAKKAPAEKQAEARIGDEVWFTIGSLEAARFLGTILELFEDGSAKVKNPYVSTKIAVAGAWQLTQHGIDKVAAAAACPKVTEPAMHASKTAPAQATGRGNSASAEACAKSCAKPAVTSSRLTNRASAKASKPTTPRASPRGSPRPWHGGRHGGSQTSRSTGAGKGGREWTRAIEVAAQEAGFSCERLSGEQTSERWRQPPSPLQRDNQAASSWQGSPLVPAAPLTSSASVSVPVVLKESVAPHCKTGALVREELVKVPVQYDDAQASKKAKKEELASGLQDPQNSGLQDAQDEPEAEGVDQWDMVEQREGHKVKTAVHEPSCELQLSVWKEEQSGRYQLRAREGKGEETRIAIPQELVEELDSSSPWVDLFSRVGISSDEQPRILLKQLLGEKEVAFQPDGVSVLCRIHRFDAWRYYVSGTSLATSFMSDYVIAKDDLQADDDLSSAINAGTDGIELVEILLSKMSFKDEGDGFYFGEH